MPFGESGIKDLLLLTGGVRPGTTSSGPLIDNFREDTSAARMQRQEGG
jgi:hypothetical protein